MGLQHSDPYVPCKSLASLRNTHLHELIWHCISLVFLVRPQSLSPRYVANIAIEYSFIVLRHSEMHQALHKELLTQTPSKGLLSK